jgi:hypothetical protein
MNDDGGEWLRSFEIYNALRKAYGHDDEPLFIRARDAIDRIDAFTEFLADARRAILRNGPDRDGYLIAAERFARTTASHVAARATVIEAISEVASWRAESPERLSSGEAAAIACRIVRLEHPDFAERMEKHSADLAAVIEARIATRRGGRGRSFAAVINPFLRKLELVEREENAQLESRRDLLKRDRRALRRRGASETPSKD